MMALLLAAFLSTSVYADITEYEECVDSGDGTYYDYGFSDPTVEGRVGSQLKFVVNDLDSSSTYISNDSATHCSKTYTFDSATITIRYLSGAKSETQTLSGTMSASSGKLTYSMNATKFGSTGSNLIENVTIRVLYKNGSDTHTQTFYSYTNYTITKTLGKLSPTTYSTSRTCTVHDPNSGW